VASPAGFEPAFQP